MNTNMNTSFKIKDLVSVTEFRNKMMDIFEEVVNGTDKLIIKNNKPEVVLISLEEYTMLKEKEEDLELLEMAIERSKGLKEQDYISSDDIMKKYNLDSKEISELKDIVEIE